MHGDRLDGRDSFPRPWVSARPVDSRRQARLADSPYPCMIALWLIQEEPTIMSDLDDVRSRPRHPGVEIRLADDRMWTFPDPDRGEWRRAVSTSIDYLRILGSIMESQDDAQLARSKLSLAIFLLGMNYQPTSEQYSRILNFPAGSRASAAWRSEFNRVVESHVNAFRGLVAQLRATAPPPAGLRGWWSRISARFRKDSTNVQKWSLDSGSREF